MLLQPRGGEEKKTWVSVWARQIFQILFYHVQTQQFILSLAHCVWAVLDCLCRAQILAGILKGRMVPCLYPFLDSLHIWPLNIIQTSKSLRVNTGAPTLLITTTLVVDTTVIVATSSVTTATRVRNWSSSCNYYSRCRYCSC